MVIITVQRFNLDHVQSNIKTLFNSNNHWTNNEKPATYDATCNRSQTKNWVSKFHDKETYKTLTITGKSTIGWMKRAIEIGAQTGRCSQMFAEEIQDLVAEFQSQFLDHLQTLNATETGVFIRTEHVSLKYGQHGVGPYKDLKNVLESIVSSSKGHECLRADNTECVIYMFPWVKIHPDLEFRVFVHQNSITGISHQNLFSVNRTLSVMTDGDLEERIVAPLLRYFDEHIKKQMAEFGNYCIDFAFSDVGGEGYFIEANPFGAENAAGSALFHWLKDSELLLGDGSRVELRFNDRDEPVEAAVTSWL
ncbi:UNVERIFIED_CONTAM: hypothetical protein HDU68_001615 [Siphonaria sp. JEL0065]|nr:hypothetical protein HDU68_001615 [Siphonaria sp. JEL0065]